MQQIPENIKKLYLEITKTSALLTDYFETNDETKLVTKFMEDYGDLFKGTISKKHKYQKAVDGFNLAISPTKGLIIEPSSNLYLGSNIKASVWKKYFLFHGNDVLDWANFLPNRHKTVFRLMSKTLPDVQKVLAAFNEHKEVRSPWGIARRIKVNEDILASHSFQTGKMSSVNYISINANGAVTAVIQYNSNIDNLPLLDNIYCLLPYAEYMIDILKTLYQIRNELYCDEYKKLRVAIKNAEKAFLPFKIMNKISV